MTVDTNIIVAYLSGERVSVDTLTFWRNNGKQLYLSTIVETEVLSFTGWTQLEQSNTEKFLEQNFTSIAFDRAVARIAARIRRETKMKFPDSAIAATALFTNTPLVTRNVRDFKRVSGLSIVEL